MTLAPGTIIAGYRIERLLGVGGMGAVYLCNHPRLPAKQVALKVLSDQLAVDPDYRRRFAREADLGSRLNHHAIAHVYDLGDDDGTLWIAMEYVDGENLAHRLHRAPLTVESSLSILRDLANGIDHAHRNGVLHRDIKPHNILISEGRGADNRLTVKLADFGVARDLGSPATTNAFATLDYAAPECLLTRTTGSVESDIYSFTVVAYVMLSGGQLPYPRSESLSDTLLAHVSGAPPMPLSVHRDTPQAVEDALAKGMAAKPSERPQSAGALIDAIEAGFAPAFADTPVQLSPFLKPPAAELQGAPHAFAIKLSQTLRRAHRARLTVPALAVTMATIIGLAVAASGTATSESPAASPGVPASTPWVQVSVDQVSGPLTLAHRPTRIAALGNGDAELVADLGITPVIVSDGDTARPPSGIVAESIPTAGVSSAWDLQALRRSGPDLIIDTDSGTTTQQYSALEKIAPTLTRPPNSRMWQWTSRLRWIANALGVTSTATDVVANVNTELGRISAEHPTWSGKTIGVVMWDGLTIRPVHSPSSTSDFLQGCGFVYSRDDEWYPDETDPSIAMIGPGGDEYSYLDSGLDIGIVLRTDVRRGGGGYDGLPYSLYTSDKPLVVVDDPETISDLLVGGPITTGHLLSQLVPTLVTELGS